MAVLDEEVIVLHQLVDQHRPEARALVRRGLWNQNFLEIQDFEFVLIQSQSYLQS